MIDTYIQYNEVIFKRTDAMQPRGSAIGASKHIFFFDARGCIHYTVQKNSHSAHSTSVAHSRRTPYPDYPSAPHFYNPRHLCLPLEAQLALHPFKTALPYGIGSPEAVNTQYT